MFEKCLIYTRPSDGRLLVVHPLEADRRRVQIVAEEVSVRLVQAGEKVQHIRKKADGTYAPVELVSERAGLMSVRTKAPEYRLEDDTEVLERALKAAPPEEVSEPAIVLLSNIPTDRSYRNGWERSGGLVRHNMEKCRELHREKLRRERKPLLEALDVAQLRGEDVEEKKQALRDAPADPRIEAAKSVEDLKAIKLPEG